MASHGVAANAAMPLLNVRKVGVLSQPDKNTPGALVCAFANTTSWPSRNPVRTALLLYQCRNLASARLPFPEAIDETSACSQSMSLLASRHKGRPGQGS